MYHECNKWCEEQWGLPEGDLPSGWKLVVVKNSGDKYYWNTVTNETSWTRPSEPAAKAAGEAAAAGEPSYRATVPPCQALLRRTDACCTARSHRPRSALEQPPPPPPRVLLPPPLLLLR